MGYIKNNLSPNEKVVYETKLHWKIFILPVLVLILAVYLYSKDWIWLAWGLGIGGSVTLVIMLIKYLTNEFVITTNNLRFRKGLFPQTDRIPLEKITRVTLKSRYNPIDIFLDSGNMLIFTDSDEKIAFKNVFSPNEFDKKLDQQLKNPQTELSQVTPTSKDFSTKIGNFISRIPGPKKSSEVIIDLPVNFVWNFITDSKNFGNIIKGMWYWEEFDRNFAKEGMKFKRGYDDFYIVNWKPNSQFSMGHKPDAVDFDFQLTEFEGKTKVNYTRKFNVLGFILPFQDDVDYTTTQLKQKCLELALENKSKKYSIK